MNKTKGERANMKKPHYAPKQQAKKEKKALIEKMSNKLLVIFSVSLVAEILLLFLYTSFKSTGTVLYMNTFMTVTYLVFLAAFIALIVTASVLKKKGKKPEAFTTRMKNWSFVALACAVVSFLIMPNPTISFLFNLIGQGEAAQNIFTITNRVTGSKGIPYIMGALAIYVIVMFIVTNVKIKKIQKSYK
jgi:hypothetical protein